MSMKYIDCHTHSSFSPDASDSLESMVKRAQELELAAYAVTDHCDVNFWDKAENDNIIDADMYDAGEYALKSVQAVSELKEYYDNLICGIELGQPLQNLAKAELVVSDPRIDFVIGSHHMNKNENDFYYLEYNKMDIKQIETLLESCYIQMLDMCKWGKFDVLGHLTYPLRYISGEYGIDVDMSRNDDIITEIFKTLIQKGKGIEINTSGLRQKYGKTFPDLNYVKMYHDLGGEILTVGSDAHCVADLGKGIADGFEIARQAGFKYLAYFKCRKPEFLKID